jgi:two-component system OmpR family sensor kinase
MTLRLRLTFFYTVVLIAALVAFGADIWWVEGRIGIRRVDHELEGLSSTVSTLLREELDESAPLSSAADVISSALSTPDRAMAFLDFNRRPIASSWEPLVRHGVLADNGMNLRSVVLEKNAWRVRTERRAYGNRQLWLVLAASLRDVERQQHEVVETMWIALPLALLLAGGGGWWIATVALRPITEMARQTKQITATGTDTLGGTIRHDELGIFAAAFNGLLARLRDALRVQRQFMADASHELRTPVSVVRTATDVALGRTGRDEAEYRETLTIIDTQARRLSRLVDSMLVLARADAGGYPVRPVDVYLDEIVAECCQAVALSCEQRGIVLSAGPFPETAFRGDEDLLRQLVLNVLQNAVQHTPPGGNVTVDLTNGATAVDITIRDTGPGIPPADRPRIFERFVTLDAARTGGGAGLGLSIARWIAETHGGSLTLADSGASGSTFRIQLVHRAAVSGETALEDERRQEQSARAV